MTGSSGEMIYIVMTNGLVMVSTPLEHEHYLWHFIRTHLPRIQVLVLLGQCLFFVRYVTGKYLWGWVVGYGRVFSRHFLGNVWTAIIKKNGKMLSTQGGFGLKI